VSPALSLGAGNLAAQNGRPPFDPAQMKQNMVIVGATDWTSRMTPSEGAADAIGKVVDARMEIGFGGGGFGRGQGAAEIPIMPTAGVIKADKTVVSADSPAPQRGSGVVAKSIDAKAPADEIKAKLAKLREANKGQGSQA